MLKKNQIFHPSNSEKAFVYQQTQDLVSDLNNMGPVSVLLERNEQTHNFVITFSIQTSSMNIWATSEGHNLMETCMSAKNEMKKKIFQITHSMEDSPDRNMFIEELKKAPYLH